MKYVKKIGWYLSVLALLNTIAINTIPTKVSAAPVGEWQNDSSIKFADNYYIDITGDSAKAYVRSGDGKFSSDPEVSCVGEKVTTVNSALSWNKYSLNYGVIFHVINNLSGGSPATNAEYHEYIMEVRDRNGKSVAKDDPITSSETIPNGYKVGCFLYASGIIQVAIQLTDPNKDGKDSFAWANKQRIDKTDGSKSFTFDGTKYFIWNEDSTSDGCKERLTPNSLGITALYESDGNPSKLGSGCVFNKIQTVNLANKVVMTKEPVTGDSPGNATASSTTATTGKQETTCESKDQSNLGWIACAIIRAIDGTLNTINKEVISILEIKVSQFEGTNNNIKSAWSNIKNISTLLLVIIALVMVISSVLEVGPFDAYTIKKLLPRLLGAVIFMQLSWFVMIFMITITNELGKGISDIILSPFGGANIVNLSSVLAQSGAGSQLLSFNAVAIGLAGTAAYSLGVLGLLSLAFTTLISVFIGFVVLLLRNIVIITALIFAPFAIVCYILPSTKKIADFWWDAFSKGLLMYPIIMILFASGKIFAYVTASSEAGSAGWDLFQFFAVIVSYIAPYFLIPATFRLAGGAISTLSGMVNDRSKGVFDRSKKFRGNQRAKLAAENKNFSRFSDKSRLGRAGNTLIGTANNPSALRRGRAGIRAARQTGYAVGGQDALKNSRVFQAHGQDDQFLLALANEEMAVGKRDKAAKEFETGIRVNDDGTTQILNNQQRAESAKARDAYDKGINAARTVENRKQGSVRLAATNALAKTGYQFASGENGYNELSNTIRGIVGSDEGAYTSAMDEAQYHLKSAGRFDLGGINHGSGYDPVTGTDKAGLYQLANGKKQSITGMASKHVEWLNEAKSGTTTLPDGTTRALTTSEVDDRYMKATILEKELDAMLPNSTGAVRDEILKQRQSMLATGGKELVSWQQRDSGEVMRDKFGNVVMRPATAGGAPAPVRFSMDEVAGRRARNYDKPDPNHM